MNKNSFQLNRRFVPSFLCLGLLLLSACDSNKNKGAGSEDSEAKPVVAVTNYPLRVMVDRIAGDRVEILYPVDPDVDPAFWKPDGEAISRMQKADLIFLNGAGYESWLASVTLPASKTIDTTASVKDQLIEVEELVVHQHGPEGKHSHKGTAFTTWLDPDIAISQSIAIHEALVDIAPYHQAALDDNLRKIKAEWRGLRSHMNRTAEALQGQHLMASHPVYQYLQRVMKLDMHSVHFEPDADPTEEQWAEFDKMVAEHPTKLMLWEDTPLPTTAKALADRNIKVVVFSQVGNTPPGIDPNEDPASQDGLFSLLQSGLIKLEAAGLKAQQPGEDPADTADAEKGADNQAADASAKKDG